MCDKNYYILQKKNAWSSEISFLNKLIQQSNLDKKNYVQQFAVSLLLIFILELSDL